MSWIWLLIFNIFRMHLSKGAKSNHFALYVVYICVWFVEKINISRIDSIPQTSKHCYWNCLRSGLSLDINKSFTDCSPVYFRHLFILCDVLSIICQEFVIVCLGMSWNHVRARTHTHNESYPSYIAILTQIESNMWGELKEEGPHKWQWHKNQYSCSYFTAEFLKIQPFQCS